ncbi:MAG: CotH kinase family protein [Pirellulaceae bacterium]
MHLTDSADDLTAWQFPAGTVVPANGYLIVFASGENITDPTLDENGFLHTNFNLSSDGEYLAIANEVGDVIFEVTPTYPAQVTDVSYGWNGSEYRYYDSPSPGLPNGAGLMGLVEDTSFSVKRGYFDEAFELQVTSPTVGASLVYTTDGSNPTLEEGTIVPAASPDVAPVLNLNISESTTLRVAAFKDGYVPTNVDTQTYFFADDLVQQSGLWDTITEDPTWGPQLKDSLLSLPAISLVLDGRISESREVGTSVEMIFPDGEEGFQIDAGVEHYGGHSLSSPKKNMRLSFKSAYGDPTLKFDLFGEGATDEFNQLLLRTGSHDNWFWVHPAGGQGHYLRNRWAFDRQLELGDLAPHGRHVQVYINGKYEGIHHLMERPDAAFMASYLGGEPEDYDALNAGTAIDGDTDAWRMLQRNEVIDDYQEVQKLLNVENYANYMLLQFYGGNDWDWNTSQNWAAARPRLDDSGFIFFHWDSDLLLRTTRTANVITRGGPGNLWNANGGMRQHPEFLMLMADRAHALFYNDGMLTNDRVRADMEALADQIRLPVIAETARWGQRGFNGLRYTPAVWEGAIEWMFDTFLPQTGTNRTETVISQLRRANAYPDVDAPEYTVNGVRQHGGNVTSNAPLDWVAAAGTTYYMLNGEDPRLPGGDIHPDALVYDGSPVLLTESTVVKSRTKTDDEWSALSEAEFLVDVVTADATNIRITEINYHPYDPSPEEMAEGYNDADDFEFIELRNTSSQTVDLSSLRFATLQLDGAEQGVTFAFAQANDTFLRPGEFVLVVEDVSAFEARYGNQLNVAGQWSGGLSNAAETITVLAGDDLVQQFTYRDDWHVATDGNGSSLVVADVDQSLDAWNVASGWRASGVRGGSPGASDEVVSLPGDANRDGVFNSSDLVLVFAAGEFEDAILGNSTWEEGDWNQDGEFTTADLVAAFQQGNYVAAAIRLETLTLASANDVPGASNKRSGHSDRIDAAFENGAEWMVE